MPRLLLQPSKAAMRSSQEREKEIVAKAMRLSGPEFMFLEEL
ncbi:hypothetical protein C5S39_12950 [Candidatus Methanophagaceae archaeon]|nr:hypothetical protein C5S39_12950 [Methanophagales archaeon]